VHALLLQDFVPGQATELLFVAWTLSIEAMFYAFVPLAAWLVWRVAGRRAVSLNALAVGVLVLWAASLFWRMGIHLAYSPQDFQTVGGVPALVRVLHGTLPGFLLAFCPGILIFLAETPAAQERRGPFAGYRWLRERPFACAVAAVGLLVVLTRAQQRGLAAADLATALLTIPAGLGVIAVMGEGSVRHMLARVLGPVGLISYGVYLWHAVARQAILHHGGGIVPGIGDGYHSWPLHSGVLLIVTLPLALASWLVVERPLLRRTTSWDRVGGDARATSAQPVPAAAALVR
jgi:peptidoglycan/LPS O-acetylase OafA/YrhL